MMTRTKNGIELRIFSDYEEMSKAAAKYVFGQLCERGDLLLCPAAGNTPVKMYDFLVNDIIKNSINTEELRVIKLDEWGGMSAENPASCGFQIKQQLLDRIPIKDYCGFDGERTDVKSELKKCNMYLSQQGPIDICILGLGHNGHLGFNEPADNFLEPFSHSVTLSTTSLKHGMISKVSNKPKFGMTLGMQSILTSKTIILLVSGASKRQAFEQLMKRQVSTKFPASFLWLHANVICFCDEEVAS